MIIKQPLKYGKFILDPVKIGIMPRLRETTTITCQNPDCQYYFSHSADAVE